MPTFYRFKLSLNVRIITIIILNLVFLRTNYMFSLYSITFITYQHLEALLV